MAISISSSAAEILDRLDGSHCTHKAERFSAFKTNWVNHHSDWLSDCRSPAGYSSFSLSVLKGNPQSSTLGQLTFAIQISKKFCEQLLSSGSFFCKQLFFDQPIFTLISLHDTHFHPFNSLFLLLIYLHNASIYPECFPLSAHHASFHTPPSPLAEGLSLGLFPLQAADLCMPALWAGEICSIVSERRSPLDMEVVWIQAR